jgi:glycosyltransferase involved in cell wall biosynthesis
MRNIFGQEIGISAIIPTYNRAEFLREAIQSVLNQDYFSQDAKVCKWELLVVDDGSTDNTKDVVDAFGPSVRYHYLEHKGVSTARNLGLEMTRGEFVAFLDSDDLWKKEKLSTQMKFMQSHPEAMVCCTEEIWTRRGVLVNPKKRHKKSSGWVFDKFLPLCLLSLSSALFRRQLFSKIGNFDEHLPACEDYDLALRLAQKYPVHFLPEPLIIKRGGHSDQLSKKYWGMDRFRVRALEKALQLDLSPQQRELANQELEKKCQVLIGGFLKRKNQAEVDRYTRILQKYSLKGR